MIDKEKAIFEYYPEYRKLLKKITDEKRKKQIISFLYEGIENPKRGSVK